MAMQEIKMWFALQRTLSGKETPELAEVQKHFVGGRGR